MVPRSIIHQLSKLRRREVLLRLVWGTARSLAVVAIALLAACLIDYVIDREQDTPWVLRLGLFFLQAVLVVGAAALFLVKPLLGGKLSDSELALRVEDKHQKLQHRLISAVQLNQPGAETEGMSAELITKVTREAQNHA